MNSDKNMIHMKCFLYSILFIATFFSICSACAKDGGDDTPPSERLLLDFSLSSGDMTYHAAIDYDTHVAKIEGIVFGSAVTGVSCSLADGTSISPDPQEFVGNWPESQVFTVTSGTVSEEYTVILSDYEEEKVIDKAVFGYMAIRNGYDSDCGFKDIEWDCLTHLLAAFIWVNEDGSLDTSAIDPKVEEIRTVASRNGVKVLVSFLSKNGEGFGKAIQTEGLRETLAENMVNYINEHNLDGIDIDYEEYGNLTGNVPKLLDLFTRIRSKMDDDMLLTCAITPGNWLDYGKEWQTYFDYINIMIYDHLSGKDTPQQHSSYEWYLEAIDNCITMYGMPKSKLIPGLPFYGYTWDNIPGVDNVLAISYNNIIKYFSDVEDITEIDNYRNTYYNGKETIRRKCQYAVDQNLGGVMIWQIFQDAVNEEDKLINVVGEVMFPEKR